MKVYFLTILILIFLSNISESQTGWILQNGNTEKILEDVFFVNSYTGWIVTDSSRILKTTDSGLTWAAQTLPYITPLKTVFFINENTGWAAGGISYYYTGAIFKTTNGGSNWSYSVSNNIESIYFIDENTGFAGVNSSGTFGSGGYILKTTNGGAIWDGNYSGKEFSKIAFKNAQTGYILGHYWDITSNDTNFIYRTTNTGETWEVKYKKRNEVLIYGSFKDISAQGNNVWAIGMDSTVLHSADNGENWIKQSVPNPSIRNSIYFIDESTGWAVGNFYPDSSNIIKTTNGGDVWFTQRNSLGNELNSVMFVNANTGWSVGYNGTILKTTTGGLTFVNNNSSLILSGYKLYQNYPNPFNPTTNLEFGIPEMGFVTMKVFDISGKEIATLVNENKPAGNYEIMFNGSDLASGIYFYSLFIDNVKVDTRKMVLIR